MILVSRIYVQIHVVVSLVCPWLERARVARTLHLRGEMGDSLNTRASWNTEVLSCQKKPTATREQHTTELSSHGLANERRTARVCGHIILLE